MSKKRKSVKEQKNEAEIAAAVDAAVVDSDAANKLTASEDDIQTDAANYDEAEKKSIGARFKKLLGASIHTWIFKCLIVSLILELVLEMLGRRSIFGGFSFLIGSPVVYIYNVSIIFFTLLFALFLRKRVFGMILISTVWMICGIVNFIVLGFRVTPFAAIDFLMLKDTFSMINVYYSKGQQVIIVIAIIAVITLMVILFKKTPKFEGERRVKGTMLACIIAWCIVLWFTNFGVKHNFISDDFANLGTAYKDYGFAYCFTNSIIDNGISKPDTYTEEHIKEIKSELDKDKTTGHQKKPNIIVIQLESFFDPNDVAGLTMSENPLPTFTKLKEKYPSGYFTVPALGAGTANTEFEVLTGIKSSYFGAGEYPYKTTVNEVPVEGLCSLLKKQGYGTYAIHNNKSSFYDRRNVYNMMGFDAFISLEYMYDVDYTSTGWAKDATLVDDIMKCLKDTDGQDFVYTISVQGHGRYPSEENTCTDHIQVQYDNVEMEQPIHYYVNQIYEMDLMIENLIQELDAYGEEYVLVLYGDHLPSLELTEEQLPDSTLFQTEYVMVNNINLKLEDEDISASDISLKLLDALNIPLGYAQKAHKLYTGATLDDALVNIAYDMLYGENYLFQDQVMVPEGDMKMGVDKIVMSDVKNEDDHIVVSGDNFNQYSIVYVNGDRQDTIYVNRKTLMVDGLILNAGDEINVRQVDKSHHELSETNSITF
ncbi:MAG: LTA synthase family protein [Clostridium sp.]|nr:LTA synthase family protein [Clostridium sp.]MCM1398115.1 LTA synthase family protein [Clostridium sp.]MCM1459251.1 LTA synthase family protein [Bacteroides sp.]